MKTPAQKPKMYVVRKYIKAKTAVEAIKLDSTTPVHDCWIDNEWRDNHLAEAIGFSIDIQENEE
jgi:hypothetical protein